MKQNKILVAIASDDKERRAIIQRLLVKLNFALTPFDAGKLIKKSVHDIDLSDAYYVCAENFNFRDSEITRQRLYEMAARGIAVIVGVRRLPKEFEFICQAIYE